MNPGEEIDGIKLVDPLQPPSSIFSDPIVTTGPSKIRKARKPPTKSPGLQLQCILCPKLLPSKASLEKHQADKHGSPRWYQCPLCPVVKCLSMKKLTKHQELKHGKFIGAADAITRARVETKCKTVRKRKDQTATEIDSEDEQFLDELERKEGNTNGTSIENVIKVEVKEEMDVGWLSYGAMAEEKQEDPTYDNFPNDVIPRKRVNDIKIEAGDEKSSSTTPATDTASRSHIKHQFPYACKTCGYGCEHRGELNKHLRSKTKCTPSTGGYFECKECKEVHTTFANLAKHSASHGSEFKCLYCPAGYRRQPTLKKHEQKAHFAILNPFLCPSCPAGDNVRFKSNLCLEKHFKDKHGTTEDEIDSEDERFLDELEQEEEEVDNVQKLRKPNVKKIKIEEVADQKSPVIKEECVQCDDDNLFL